MVAALPHAAVGQLVDQQRACDAHLIAQERRVELLVDTTCHTAFAYVGQGLFERHKLIVATQLCMSVLRQRGELQRTKFEFLLRGPKVRAACRCAWDGAERVGVGRRHEIQSRPAARRTSMVSPPPRPHGHGARLGRQHVARLPARPADMPLEQQLARLLINVTCPPHRPGGVA